ncbi:MAG: PKD domain-containing protein [Bacteroidota bacterium]
MKRLIQILFFFLIVIGNSTAQIQDGSIAPDFTVKDIEGNQQNLYDLLAKGKSVILDFSAAWCVPCWNYHNAGPLHDYMEKYGPDGTDESMVYLIESDIATTMADLNGTGNNTQGDWVTGTNYPILDAAFIANTFEIGELPTIMMVCPDRTVKTLGPLSESQLKANTSTCTPVEVAPQMDFRTHNYAGCNSLTVEFTDVSWPRPDAYFWDFGDGITSSEANPTHTYAAPGSYNVTLQGSNSYGENETIKESYITIGEGNPLSLDKVGPENKDIGSGRYFEGGHQALIFNAMEDIVIETVNVFSDRDQNRTIVLWDSEGNVLNQRTVYIPNGEHRISLDLFVPQGTDLQLGLYSDAYLYRNDGGVQYPYTIDDLVSITSSTAPTEPSRFYYYFYDWEVRKSGCATINSTQETDTEEVHLYPIPVSGMLTIEKSTKSKNAPRIFNNIGQTIQIPMHQTGTNWQLDFSGVHRGTYFIKLDNKMYSVPRI